MAQYCFFMFFCLFHFCMICYKYNKNHKCVKLLHFIFWAHPIYIRLVHGSPMRATNVNFNKTLTN